MTRREPLITKEKFRRTGCCRRFPLRIPGELDYQIWEGAGSRLSGRNRTRKRGNRRIDTKSGQSGFRNGSRPKGPAPVEAARIAACGEVSREERIEIRWTAGVRHDTNDMIAARRCGGAPPAGGNRQPDCRPAAAMRTLAKQARVTWPPQGKRRDQAQRIAADDRVIRHGPVTSPTPAAPHSPAHRDRACSATTPAARSTPARPSHPLPSGDPRSRTSRSACRR